MNICIRTKFDIGDTVYLVASNLKMEHFVREVRIEEIVMRFQEPEYDKPYRYFFYIVSPGQILRADKAFEYELFFSREEAQAEANRLTELLRGGEGK